ncbi:MAG: Spi family protease inhibitor [Bacteroidales bacterium]|nr:Spi family protease inhibitor [Bacteroidales bacterium]
MTYMQSYRLRFILCASLLASACIDASAARVSKSAAAQRAMKFMNIERSHSRGEESVSDSTAYYVFNGASGQGFVIISAEDQMPEMLAYSRDGKWPTKKLSYLINRANKSSVIIMTTELSFLL